MQQENRENSTGIQFEAKDNSTVYAAEAIKITYELSRPSRGIPFQALALPKDYVDRPEIRQWVKSKLIDLSLSRPGTLVVSAIYGLGGVGKSVIASTLAHDAEVQGVCSDGVLWATLGQNPDILPFLYGWIQALGDYDYKPTSMESASSHLRSLLYDKKILLVVDDVWKTEHVEPFQVGGVGCRVLVTTREAYVPDAERIDMDVMSSAEALELLLSKAQVKGLTTHEEEQARKLIEVVGRLPLAVDLAGAQIADGMSWDELLEDLEAEIAYLESLDRPNSEGVKDEKTRKRLSLKASLNLSLKLLTEEQLRQFAWLGVLPEDVSIQSDMAATLWSLPRRQAGEILRTFRAKSLLLSGVQGIGQGSNYRLHDLMHDLARGVLTSEGEKDIQGLNIEFKSAHAMLLDRYRQQTRDNQWHTLTDDGYIYSYLTWHIEQSGRIDELHLLLQEVTPEGRNAWYEACNLLGQKAKFVIDLGRAWKWVKKIDTESISQSIGLQIRYALIFSTLNSLTSNIPAKLISAFVEKKKWSSAQGFAYVQQAQNQPRQVEVICELVPYLPASLLSDALEISRRMQSNHYRFLALYGLVPYLSEIANETLETVRGIQDESLRAMALNELVQYLPEHLRLDALEVARGIQSKRNRFIAFSKLIGHVPGIIHEVLVIADEIHQDEYFPVEAFNEMVSYLPENLFSEALKISRSLQTEFLRASALYGLVPYLPDIALEALDEARRIQNDYTRASALNKLIQYLPNFALEALEVTSKIQDESFRATALKILIPNLSKNLLPEALRIAFEIRIGHYQVIALTQLMSYFPEITSIAFELWCGLPHSPGKTSVLDGLIQYLPDNLLPEVLQMVHGIQDDYHQVSSLSELVPHLPEIASVTIELALGIQDENNRSTVLCGLGLHLSKNLLPEVLDDICKIQVEAIKAPAINALVPHLPPNLLPKVIDIAYGMQEINYRASMLNKLVPYFPEILSEAVKVSRLIQSEKNRVIALCELISYLPEIAHEALETVRGIPDEIVRANALVTLAQHLPQNLISEVLEMSRMQNEFSRANTLVALVPHFPEVKMEALEAIRQIPENTYRSSMFSQFLPYFPEVAWEALEVAHNVQLSYRIIALSHLVPQLPEVALEALERVRTIQDDASKTHELIGLIHYLPQSLMQEALDMVLGMNDEFSRAQAFSVLFSKMSLSSINIHFLFKIMYSLAHRERKDFLLDIPKLAPTIIDLGGYSALRLTVQAIQEVCRQWP
jgi:hypothetical protein